MRTTHVATIVFLATACAVAACSSGDTPQQAPTAGLASDQAAPQADSEWVPFVGHRYVHKSCFHIVPNHSIIDKDGNVIVGGTLDTTTYAAVGGTIVDHFAPCQHPARDASAGGPTSWLEASTTVNYSTYFTSYSGNFLVPTGTMQNERQEIYLFPSFQNNNPDIIQPVLQWGELSRNGNCSGGGWGISNWYVHPDGTGTITKPSCGVHGGDQLGAHMAAIACDSSGSGRCTWTSSIEDITQGFGNDFYDVYANAAFINAQQGALEAWTRDFAGYTLPGIADCNALPGGTSGSTWFYNESWTNTSGWVTPKFLSWYPYTQNDSPYCNYGVSIYGSREVYLQF
jgi:hypothetical protein